jgi:hypothetical protein
VLSNVSVGLITGLDLLESILIGAGAIGLYEFGNRTVAGKTQ